MIVSRIHGLLHSSRQLWRLAPAFSCGIGITLDTLTGFYPEAGTKEYDIYGQALVLATRYEGMRKTLFEAEKGRSVLIIQSVVYDSLDPSHREGFIELVMIFGWPEINPRLQSLATFISLAFNWPIKPLTSLILAIR